MIKRYRLSLSRAASGSVLASLLWIAAPSAYAIEANKLAGH